MSARHTPGPWRAHPTGQARSGKPEFEIHWSDIGECVAEIVHGEEDARLIAAAPDLLAALLAFRNVAIAGGGDFAGWHDAYAPAVTLARAAIAYATGEPA